MASQKLALAAGSGGWLWGGLQDGNALVIAEEFDGGALLNEMEVVVEVVTKLGKGKLICI